jgi:hypothetical protein
MMMMMICMERETREKEKKDVLAVPATLNVKNQ